MKIVVFSGSARSARRSHQVAVEVVRRLEAKGHTCTLLDVKALNFPLLDQKFEEMESPPEAMQAASKSLKEADGILLVSPEHNNSYSGALKNTMDHFYQEYRHKAFGAVAVSDGRLGGINAAKDLLKYAQTLQGIVLPNFMLTPQVQNLFTDGKLTDEKYALRLDKFLTGFLWLARTVSNAEK